MKSYTQIPHTSDIRLIVRADTLENLFSSALEALTDFIKPVFDEELVTEVTTIKFNIESIDRTVLLIDFLSEALMNMQKDKISIIKSLFFKLTETETNGLFYGIPVTEFEEDVKAVTYHEANIKEDSDGILETTVIFDI